MRNTSGRHILPQGGGVDPADAERRSARAAIFRSDVTIDGCWCATKPGNEDIALPITAFPLKIDAKSII